MSIVNSYPHISIDEAGIPRIAGSRYKVAHLAGEHYHYGWSAEELLKQHPDLKPEEIYAALTYFYDHFDAIVQALDATAESAASARGPQRLSRDELLRRKASMGSS